ASTATFSSTTINGCIRVWTTERRPRSTRAEGSVWSRTTKTRRRRRKAATGMNGLFQTRTNGIHTIRPCQTLTYCRQKMVLTLGSTLSIDPSAHAVTIGVALRWVCCEKSPTQFFTDERDPKRRTIVLKKQTRLIREAGRCS